MDSILELERSGNKELFHASAAPLFDDCFNLLLSQGAKPEAFNLLKSLSDPAN